VEELREQRVGAQPVGVVVGVGLRALIRTMEARDGESGGGLLRDEIVRARCAEARQQRVGQGFVDFGDEAVLGFAAELTDVELKGLRELDEERAADVTFVALDEVEVAGRDAGSARQLGLRHAVGASPGADPEADGSAHFLSRLSLY
jgi:hypothetical protein